MHGSGRDNAFGIQSKQREDDGIAFIIKSSTAPYIDTIVCVSTILDAASAANANNANLTKTRSSAVAVIADRTVYDVRYTGKLSNRFRLQVYVLPVARSDSNQRAEFMNAPKLYLLKRD